MPVKKLGAAVHHHNSAAMSALLSPTLGIRDAQRKAGLTPRDHSKDNRQIIKELSRANKGKKLEEAAKALDGSSTFSLSLLSGAQSAQSSSLDAGRALADAYDAAEEAVKKEAVAEAALEASEALIEQYENEGGGLSPID